MASKVKLPRPIKAPKVHVRTGDKVVVLSGENRGKTGTVIKVFPREQRALVEGDAAVFDTRHVKANPQAGVEGGRIKRLRPHACRQARLGRSGQRQGGAGQARAHRARPGAGGQEDRPPLPGLGEVIPQT